MTDHRCIICGNRITDPVEKEVGAHQQCYYQQIEAEEERQEQERRQQEAEEMERYYRENPHG